MPSSAPLSTSVTLSSWPLGDAKSTRLDTRAPTAPDGGPGSSASVPRLGVLVVSSTGASLAGVPVTFLMPVTGAATPSDTLVRMVKLVLTLAAVLKVTPASRMLTSAIGPEAVHTPALKVEVTAPEVAVLRVPAAGLDRVR